MNKSKQRKQSTAKSRNQCIELYLREFYGFRFNTIKCRTEYRRLTENEFKPVTRFVINSIRRELDQNGISSSFDNLRAILDSDFAPPVNPVQEYFRTLPKSTKQDMIKRLAATVVVCTPDRWEEYLTKWLTGVVANALSDAGCQNHVCLVLTGSQGKFKTTWLDLLCPPLLKKYLFTGKIDPQSKDVLTLIAECLFINIDDQLKALNKRNENELKNLITAPFVKYRRPYDVFIEDYPHLASFMASVNGNDFLTDPTGSRRFLPFEVQSIAIDDARKINMDDIYAEAMYLLNSGFQYWFNDAEIEELHKHSSPFQVQSVEYEMLLQFFKKPSVKKDAFMTSSQITSYLQSKTQLNLSGKRIGEALHKLGFERKTKRIASHPVYGWIIEEI